VSTARQVFVLDNANRSCNRREIRESELNDYVAQTWTAVYAIERGVTVVRPMSDATLDRVAELDFLTRFAVD
jgi:hypothetical protein